MTRTAITTYYLAICIFLICLVTLVVKLTFWPVCTSASTCDGWTVAGLVGAIMGLSAVFLGILGAIALAAWWLSLETRVEDRVTQLFTTRIQAVQDSIDQLNGRAEELRTKVDTIEEMIPELQQRINMVQNIAQVAFDETMPPNLKALRDHERRMQKTTDQQEQSPDTR